MDLFYESKYNFGIETSIGDKGYNMSYFHKLFLTFACFLLYLHNNCL